MMKQSIKQRTDSLIALSSVVNQFIDVKRATIRRGKPETDGEHTLHLQMLAVAYATQYHPELDAGLVAMYALVHDFVEVYAGDVNSLGVSDVVMAKKQADESAALERLQEEFCDSWPEFINLVVGYELLETPESRFVKTFDKCDPGFSHLVNSGQALINLGIVTRDDYVRQCEVVKGRMRQYSDEFPDVLLIREEIQHRIADKMFGIAV